MASSPKPSTDEGQEAKILRLNEFSEEDLNVPLRVLACKPSELSDIPDNLEYVTGGEESEEDEDEEETGSIRNLCEEQNQEEADKCSKVRDRIVMAYVSDDYSTLKVLVRVLETLEIRKVTLVTSGLGHLVNTAPIWAPLGGVTIRRMQKLGKQWKVL